MDRDDVDEMPLIHPDMSILDIVSRYRRTEQVFRRHDRQAGVCLCCRALFDPLREVARKYHLDLDRLTRDLEAAAAESGPS